MTVVVDASVVVAVLLDDGPAGAWAAAALRGQDLVAPELLLFEVANVLRRLAGSGAVPDEVASLAHADLLVLDVALWPYVALSHDTWAYRGSLTAYDASYVACALQTGAPLLTLDERLARTARRLCNVRTPTG